MQPSTHTKSTVQPSGRVLISTLFCVLLGACGGNPSGGTTAGTGTTTTTTTTTTPATPALQAVVDKYAGTWVSNCLTNTGNSTQSGTFTMTIVKSPTNELNTTLSASVYSGLTCAGAASPSTSFTTTSGALSYFDTAADGRDRFNFSGSSTGKDAMKITANLLYLFNAAGAKDAQGYPLDVMSGGLVFVKQ